MKTFAVGALSAMIFSGCCVMPNSVGPELAHASHITQHQPFTSHPTNTGYQTIGVAAHWRASGWYADVSEAYNFAPYEGTTCAGMCGSREVFDARVGYEFKIKP